MALNLNIPELKDKPFIIAETRPNKISASLEHLQTNNALDFSAHLRAEMTVLNRQKVSANTRIQALNVYRKSVINTVQLLAKDYSNATLPLHSKAKLAANATEGLWQELGFGYKLALVDLQTQLISLGRNKDTIYVIERAMHAVTEQALVYFQTYSALPTHIWEDIYQLYFCAVQLGIQHESMMENEVNVWSKTHIPFSIENAFKHALLMFLANPQNLTQKEIRLTAEYLAHHVRDAAVTAVTPLAVSYGAFIISLASSTPPDPYSKQKDAPDPHVDILLQTIELVRVIHSNLSILQNKQLPIDGSIPANANREDYIQLLTHLIKHLGITPKRQYKRSQKYGELELVTGIPAAHFLSGNQISETSMALSSAGRVLQSHTANPITTSRWQILNMSASGMCIRRHPTAEKNIKIGHLVGIRVKGEHHWALAVVRWAHCGNRDTLMIGIQLIAPYAQNATLSCQKWDHEEMALLLPHLSTGKEQTSIIAPKGTFDSGLRISLKWNDQSHPVILTKLIDRTQQFERIQFAMSK
jgi:cyclic-di-GMP-binding protein